MHAVSNTSPISGLAYIGRLSLLKSQFEQILIPPSVAYELEAHPDPSASAMIQQALNDWIRVAVASETHFLRLLLLRLDRAEAEAIALADEMAGSMLLLDELEGRRLAKQAGLSVVGTLGVLLRAKNNGTIPALKPEIDALRAKANFFVSQKLEAQILSAAGE
jgi:uncharacterized protein